VKIGVEQYPGAARERVAEKRSFVSRNWAVFAAAAVVLAILAGIVSMQIPRAGTDSSVASLSTGAGEIRTVRLSDGSRLTLDAKSSVTSLYTAGERRLVLVNGRARFVVAHEEQRAFIVVADNTLIVAHGTVFDVMKQGGTIQVDLLKGSVEVQRSHNSGQAPTIVGSLVPGQRLTVDETESHPVPKPVLTEESKWPPRDQNDQRSKWLSDHPFRPKA
jgi:transmembrane sensor